MLVITLGDPFSINVECIAKVLTTANLQHPVLVIGNYYQWCYQTSALGLSLPIKEIVDTHSIGAGELAFFDIPGPQKSASQLTRLERGCFAAESLAMIKRLRADRLAVVTGSIDKSAAHIAGFDFPGHTEYFESLWHGQGLMLMLGTRLRVGLVTNHVPVRYIADRIDSGLVIQKAGLLIEGLRQLAGISNPRVAVCGLNPHAGDRGLFGDEDEGVIAPAVASLRRSGARIEGPLSADTVFYRALRGEFDGVLAQYHDQGLGPLKLVDFDSVNVTYGLKNLRVSPDHGPAQDLFLKNQAGIESWRQSIDLASRYLGMAG